MSRLPRNENAALALAIVAVFVAMMLVGVGLLKDRHKARAKPRLIDYDSCYVWTDGVRQCLALPVLVSR